MEGMIIAVVIIDAIICAGLAGNIADKKGYDSGSWAACGFFFGLLGLIAAAGLPTMKTEPQKSLQKICPDCAEVIKTQALVCRHCGRKFERERVVSSIRSVLGGKDTARRIQAMEALGRIGAKEAVPDLIRALQETNHVDGQFHAMAGWALGKLADESAVPLLADVLKTDAKPAVHRKALQILGGIGSPIAVPLLIGALGDQFTRAQAKSALVAIGKPALPSLMQAADADEGKMGKILTQIIADIGSEDSQSTL